MHMLTPIARLRPSLLVAILLMPVFAHAQDERLRLSFGVATTAGAIDSEPAIAASVGYRFMNRVSFDVEVTAAEGVTDRFSRIRLLGSGGVSGGVGGSDAILDALGLDNVGIEHEGRTVLATFGFRYELPSQSSRFAPYVTAGIGVARLEDHYDVSIASVAVQVPGVGVTIFPPHRHRQRPDLLGTCDQRRRRSEHSDLQAHLGGPRRAVLPTRPRPPVRAARWWGELSILGRLAAVGSRDRQAVTEIARLFPVSWRHGDTCISLLD